MTSHADGLAEGGMYTVTMMACEKLSWQIIRPESNSQQFNVRATDTVLDGHVTRITPTVVD